MMMVRYSVTSPELLLDKVHPVLVREELNSQGEVVFATILGELSHLEPGVIATPIKEEVQL